MNRSIDNVRDILLRAGEEPPLAAHLVTPRTLYSHHGIYVGGGRVIHYAGLAYGLQRGAVEEVSLERFARGRGVRIRPDASRFDDRQAVARARTRLGERRYRLLTNNCRHFCAWVLRGASVAGQARAKRRHHRVPTKATRAGTISVTRVPDPGMLVIVSSPPTRFARSCIPIKPKCPSRPPSSSSRARVLL